MPQTVRTDLASESVPKGIDRRAFPRRLAKGVARCRTDKWGMGPIIVGNLVDLSPDGAMLNLPEPVRTGLEIQMEITGYSCRAGIRVQGTVLAVEPDDDGRWWMVCRFSKRLTYEQLADLVR